MNKQPSTALIVALTVIGVCGIGAVTLILITLEESQLPEGWLGLLLGSIAGIITALVTLGRVEKIGRQVDDLSNGLMDAKIRAAVADVVKDEHLDPDQAEQIERDRVRRNKH